MDGCCLELFCLHFFKYLLQLDNWTCQWATKLVCGSKNGAVWFWVGTVNDGSSEQGRRFKERCRDGIQKGQLRQPYKRRWNPTEPTCANETNFFLIDFNDAPRYHPGVHINAVLYDCFCEPYQEGGGGVGYVFAMHPVLVSSGLRFCFALCCYQCLVTVKNTAGQNAILERGREITFCRVFWLRGQLWAGNFGCLHRVIGCEFTEYAFAHKRMLNAEKTLVRKVRESCNSLAYCSRGNVLTLTDRVKISINAIYLYRADQVVMALMTGRSHVCSFFSLRV